MLYHSHLCVSMVSVIFCSMIEAEGLPRATYLLPRGRSKCPARQILKHSKSAAEPVWPSRDQTNFINVHPPVASTRPQIHATPTKTGPRPWPAAAQALLDLLEIP